MMRTRYSTKVESKRIPAVADEETTAALLSSQETTLKNTDSQSQSQSSQTETQPQDRPFTLRRSSSSFFAPSSSSPQSSTKKHKAFHSTNGDDKEEVKGDKEEVETVSIPPLADQPSIAQPLSELVERHLAQIHLNDNATEKAMVAKFLYKLAEAYQNKNVNNAAYISRKLKPRKIYAAPKSPEEAKKIAAKQKIKIKKSRQADIKHLDKLIRDAIIASAALEDKKAQTALEKYQIKHPKRVLPKVDPLFTGNPASYFPALISLVKKAVVDIDFNFSPDQARAIMQSLLPILDGYFKNYRNSLLPTSSLSPRP
jgi:hypothetical protein